MVEDTTGSGDAATAPKLSICIATYARGRFIGETLDSILGQWQPDVELVIVDGASPDDTPDVVSRYVSRHPGIRYYRESENSGVDRDYDKAVGYARGEYCWLMTDDDLLRPGALATVLAHLDRGLDLIVVNAEVRSVDFSRQLAARFIDVAEDRAYGEGDHERLFADTATGLSFIGCVIVRREAWLRRERAAYYGSLFVHVGVIFQHPPVARAGLVAEPLVTIRYGNAMWAPRWFEIWLFKWPQLLWSFADYSDRTKASVYPREPWKDYKRLLYCRATGGYTAEDYRRHLAGRTNGARRVLSYCIAVFPGVVANALASLYLGLLKRGSRISVDNLSRSPHANAVTRWVARALGV